MPNDTTHTQKPFYATILVKYPSEADCPRVGANEPVLGGELVGISFTDMFAEMEEIQASRTPAEPKGEIRAIKDEAASTDRVPVYRTESAEPKAGDWGARAFIIDHNKRMYAAGEDEKQAAFELERSVSILNTRALSSAAIAATNDVSTSDRLVDAPRITGDSDKSDLPIANSVQLSEKMVERVIHDFVDPIAASLDPTAYDDGAEYAALEIKDRLISLLRQQGPPPFTPTQTEESDA